MFVKRLKDKKQNEEQRKQAFYTVTIFYELKNSGHDKIGILKNKKENVSIKNAELKSMRADWSPVYNDLNAEIKLRHIIKKY